MVWFKVDDGLAFHHKVIAAGNAAMGMWVRAGSVSADQLTDGFIPDHMAAALGTAAQAARLVEVGLWLRVDGGYQFHQWSDGGRQPTRADVEAEREAARKRMEAHRRRRGSPEPTPNQHGSSAEVRDVFGDPDPTRPVVPTELPKRARGAPKVGAPDLLPITDSMRRWADAAGVTCDLTAATAEMLDHHRAKGSTFADWPAAWRTWMTRTKRYGGPAPVVEAGTFEGQFE